MKLLSKCQAAAFIGIGLVSVTVLAARLARGQAAPVLGISQTSNNAVLVTVTNGVSTGRYQIYWTEFLADPDWLLLTNGSIGQTQFLVPMEDWVQTFFSATANTNFVLPSLNVIILSPTNGALLY
jgi:glucose-6-phosphate-specific signal transduction histidine kinase